ncbi:hypothetical protein DFP72DRAFT_7933 [Ephemerocybe angulata]|uniref:Secreted protein n=1 Tax=Ephemerocybe angulata TaxID=980116 RepID=A0A8H6IKG1_9AGAR|nr:hypothetical protein DFP72DRAFT_7933 [Tulosesus angulatus]
MVPPRSTARIVRRFHLLLLLVLRRQPTTSRHRTPLPCGGLGDDFPALDIRPGGVGVRAGEGRGGEVLRDDAAPIFSVFPFARGGVDGLVVLRPYELAIVGDLCEVV